MFAGHTIGAVIAAAGSGVRLGGPVPKQWIAIAGTPLVRLTTERLISMSVVDALVVVVNREMVDTANRLLGNLIPGKTSVVAGGEQRQDSVWLGLRAIEKDLVKYVLIHDAARPFVREAVVRRVLEAAIRMRAAVPGIQPKDTLKKVGSDGIVTETPDRVNWRLIQTPQAFSYDLISQAYADARKNRKYCTDDAALVELLGEKVQVVEGDEDNIKITTQEDLLLAGYLLAGDPG